jgi:hypothetical protein
VRADEKLTAFLELETRFGSAAHLLAALATSSFVVFKVEAVE